jgi:hypothetical protein
LKRIFETSIPTFPLPILWLLLIGDWKGRTCIQVCSRSKVPTDVARGSGFGIEVVSKFVRGHPRRRDIVGNTAVDRELPLLEAARIFINFLASILLFLDEGYPDSNQDVMGGWEVCFGKPRRRTTLKTRFLPGRLQCDGSATMRTFTSIVKSPERGVQSAARLTSVRCHCRSMQSCG